MIGKDLDDIPGESEGQSRQRHDQTGSISGGNNTTSVMFHDIYHPSFPLVKPVRTFLPLCISFVLAALVATESQAQITPRSRSVRQSEQTARASWQPTRSQPTAAPQQEPPNSLRVASAPRSGSVRTVQAVRENVPLPPPDESISIVEEQGSRILSETEMYDGQILDGQIQLAPVYGGGACDALPMGSCGCGDAFCTGCDGTLACDACGDFCGGSCCGELCSTDAWRPCITLCLPQDGWVSYEFLGWYQDGMPTPALITTSVDPNVTRDQAGVLTNPTTRILFGDSNLLTDAIDGSRLRFGVWLDRCHTWGVGAEFLGMNTQYESYSATSQGRPVLARPFFNTQTGVEDSELVAFPNVVSGTVSAAASSQFQGAGFHVRRLRRTEEGCKKWLFCGCPEHFCSRTELLVGYRYLQLEEGIAVSESLVSTDPSNPGAFEIVDGFNTKNQFNGIDLGWMYRHTRGYWTLDGAVRLAVGNTRQTVRIAGATQINDPSETPNLQTYPGGLLALSSNIGSYSQNEFSVVPEFGITCGYQMTDHIRLTLGYTGIYWSNVVRPGQQISPDVNPNLLPPVADPFSGANRPAFAFDTTDYWIQGINLGGEYRW